MIVLEMCEIFAGVGSRGVYSECGQWFAPRVFQPLAVHAVQQPSQVAASASTFEDLMKTVQNLSAQDIKHHTRHFIKTTPGQPVAGKTASASPSPRLSSTPRCRTAPRGPQTVPGRRRSTLSPRKEARLATLRRLQSPQCPHYPRPVPGKKPPGLRSQHERLLCVRSGGLGEGVPADSRLQDRITTPFGLFEFPFMTFGLRNAAQTFQRFMDEVTRGLDFCFV